MTSRDGEADSVRTLEPTLKELEDLVAFVEGEEKRTNVQEDGICKIK